MNNHRQIPGSVEPGAGSNLSPFIHSKPAPMDDALRSRLLTRFQPRISNYNSVSHDACIECHIDLFERDGVGKMIGGMNAHDGDFIALCAPEALPERIGFCSYFNEYGFLDDDTSVDAIQPARPVLTDPVLTRALGAEKAEDITTVNGNPQRKQQIMAKIWAIQKELDPAYLSRCQTALRQWFETAQQIRDQCFTDIDDYLATRAVDCGANGLVLTPEEYDKIGPVTYLAYVVLAITNDFWSWEKEKRATRESEGSAPLVNAVQLVMEIHNTDEESAKEIVCNIIQEHEERYCRLRDEHLKRPDITLAIKKWFRIVELSIAGNAMWSIRVLRYHQDVQNPYEGTFDFPSVFSSLKITQYAPDVQSEREDISDALQEWYQLPQPSLAIVSGIATLLHEASHMLNDVQHVNPLRRGKPAVHRIFGVGQTINSACSQINYAQRICLRLSASASLIFSVSTSDQLAHLFAGQAHGLHWARHKTIPTEEEYFRMVDGKIQENGSLLVLISRLMQNEATQNSTLDLTHFMNLIGRAYQLGDDYQCLASADYTTQRGLCQCLGQGVFSYPLLRALQNSEDPTVLVEWLQHHGGSTNNNSPEITFIFGLIERNRGLEATRDVLHELSVEIMRQLEMIESKTRVKNWLLGSILAKLQNDLSSHKSESKKEDTLEKVLRVWGGYRDEAWRDVLN
ncbi:polyprenyl synthetase [Aspergillus luchuensis]|uniref:Polyprenyl synthetase n=1 Tax=Aspergillus kawachii TaxID=1069201 RepID=A0A146FRI7_ASPKA|nr:polyprenyl synthetase [Aspergillus luchuensis]